MKGFACFLFLVAVVYNGTRHRPDERPMTEHEKYVLAVINGEIRPHRTVATRNTAGRSIAPRGSSVVRVDASSSSVEMIRQTASAFDVPAGQLYGHWTAESGRLEAAYGGSSDWLTADELGSGGRCIARYPRAAKRCQESERILAAICAQRKPDGSHVCDTSTVRLSIAYAMGPMQLMPTTLAFLKPDGSVGWTSVAVDADGDGVIDPFSRADAFASAAKLLRIGYDRKGSWLGAIDRYYGEPKSSYRRSVIRGWNEWCSKYGCESSDLVAAL